MSWPTADHVIYIPAILMVGAAIGYFFGVRAARSELAKKKARDRE